MVWWISYWCPTRRQKRFWRRISMLRQRRQVRLKKKLKTFLVVLSDLGKEKENTWYSGYYYTAQEAEVTETEDQGDRVASVSSGSVLLVFTEGNVLTTRSRKLEEKNSTTTTTTREGSSTRIGEKVVSKCTSKDEKLRESLTKLEHDGAYICSYLNFESFWVTI